MGINGSYTRIKSEFETRCAEVDRKSADCFKAFDQISMLASKVQEAAVPAEIEPETSVVQHMLQAVCTARR